MNDGLDHIDSTSIPGHDSDIQGDFLNVKVKTELDEELNREVFYFNSSNHPRTFMRDNQQYEVLGATMSLNNQLSQQRGQVMVVKSQDEEENKMAINLGSLLKLHIPEIKDEEDTSAMHYVKYKSDENGKNVKVWECGICHKEFGHQYILMRHLPTHTDERKYQCKQCGKAFRQMSTLSQHRAIHSKLRPYVCEVCQKTFNRVSTLISHRKTHTGLKPHRCHLCNKAFHQKGNLRNHIFTHTNERPYKCDVCNKGFNQMSNLMCHKFKAHQRADKPKYHCPTCGKLFDRRIGLRNHEQYEHGDPNHASSLSVAAIMNTNMNHHSAPTSSHGRDAVTPSVKYTNGVFVPRICTQAMKHIEALGQVPFALVKPLEGVPVLVRVLAANEQHMLVPATAEDLKKYGKLTPKLEPDVEVNKENYDAKEADEGTVSVSVPVVATIIQRRRKGGVRMMILNPGPDAENEFRSSQNSDDESIEDFDDDQDEGESSVEEKDYFLDYDDNSIMSNHDPNMYDAAASLIDLGARPQSIDVDSSSVHMFNHEDVDIDITNSMVDLEKDENAYGLIAESGYNLIDDRRDIDKEMKMTEIDRLSERLARNLEDQPIE